MTSIAMTTFYRYFFWSSYVIWLQRDNNATFLSGTEPVLESILQQDLKDQNMYTRSNGIHYGDCILYGDSIMNTVEMCVPVLILKVLL